MLTLSKTEHKLELYLDSFSQKCICGRNTLVIGQIFVILFFNDGSAGILNILNYFGSFKQVTQLKDIKRNKSWVREAVYKSPEKTKKTRKDLRSIKKRYSDKEKDKEKVES